MATHSLFRSFPKTLTLSLTSFLSTSTNPAHSRSALSLIRPLAAACGVHLHRISPASSTIRGFATRTTSSSLNDPNPNWSNRPPKETILLDGCDFEHWLVVMEKPEGDPTRDDIIDSYIKTLAMVVGSEEEARMKIYSVSTRCYFAFGALVSEELSYKIKDLPKVRWVLPDSYLDVRNKDYGGEPFINGQAVPYDPKYHEEWIRNNARANDRNRRNDRPRNFDRSRTFDRRRENMVNQEVQNRPPMPNQTMQNPGPNMNVTPSNNMAGQPTNNTNNFGAPNNYSGPPNNYAGPSNNSARPPNNYAGPPNNYAGPPNNYAGPPNNYAGQPNNMPPNNYSGPPNNMGGMPPNNIGGVSHNAGWSNNQNGYPPNRDMGPGGNAYRG